jgi:hypothetical protein
MTRYFVSIDFELLMAHLIPEPAMCEKGVAKHDPLLIRGRQLPAPSSY